MIYCSFKVFYRYGTIYRWFAGFAAVEQVDDGLYDSPPRLRRWLSVSLSLSLSLLIVSVRVRVRHWLPRKWLWFCCQTFCTVDVRLEVVLIVIFGLQADGWELLLTVGVLLCTWWTTTVDARARSPVLVGRTCWRMLECASESCSCPGPQTPVYHLVMINWGKSEEGVREIETGKSFGVSEEGVVTR